ncbi:MAG TPA: 30S ribosomal protein S20 [Patescibacteria group bacterium]|nr:30S ribosomal protein S20 [Patescibacteria group bacterium]
MPVIKSAIKKLRRDRKREKANDAFRADLDRAINAAKKQKTAKTVSTATSIVDRAVKKHLMPKGRADRIKSSLSKLSKPASKAPKTTSEPKKAETKTTAKTVAKKPNTKAAKPSPKKSK